MDIVLAVLIGGIVSYFIYDFVSKKVELQFSDLGNQKVKNTVLHAYDVIIEGLAERVLEDSSNNLCHAPPCAKYAFCVP